MIEILIADDKQSVREILKSYIKEDSALKIIGYAENGQRGKSRENTDLSNLNTRITTVEMQINRLSSRFEKLNKKSNFTQQFIGTFVLCNILLIVLFLLFLLVF